MKTAARWFADYSQTHQNPRNKMIHYFCVPLIMWSVLAGLTCLPFPFQNEISSSALHFFTNWGWVFTLAASLFYASLGFRYFLTMLVLAALMLGATSLLGSFGVPIAKLAAGVFVAAWGGQFYGHKVEGKKPSFFEDLQFLLIGPLWIAHSWLSRPLPPSEPSLRL